MRRLPALTVVVVLLLAGCGDGGRTCARSNDDAELCLARRSGSYQIEGQGLKPGSEVVIRAAGKALGQSQRVGEDGRPQGVVGLLGQHLGHVTVEGVAPSGERLHLAVDDD